MSAYRIITFDGGGIRGLYSAILVQRLLAKYPSLLDKTALFAGTSTGGIIALALAANISPDIIIRWYREKSRDVFDDSLLDNIRDAGSWTGAQYSSEKLKKALTAFFRQTSAKLLGDLPHRVLIPAFDLDREDQEPRSWKPKFFHNYPGDSDRKERIIDVAMRTSAAPTYFPTYQGYIDGGVMANNPCMSALAQALHPGTGNQALADIRLLSLGTGANPFFIPGQTLDWGKIQWAGRIVDVLIDGVMHVAAYQCEQVLGPKQFFRLNEFLPIPVNMDDVARIDELADYAYEVDLAAAEGWIAKHYL